MPQMAPMYYWTMLMVFFNFTMMMFTMHTFFNMKISPPYTKIKTIKQNMPWKW